MKIMVDGLNLALTQGTGVATYARNLTFNLKALGHEVHVLYGLRRSPDQSAIMREIFFYDDFVHPRGRIQRIIEPSRQRLELISCLFRPLSAYEIPASGLVINQPFAARMPSFDKLWNVPNLFELSHHAFHYFKCRPSVTLKPPIEIMHWTYPIPARVNGAKNIYVLHDLVPLRLPYTTLDNKVDYYKLMKVIVGGADHIITVSENSKRDIVEMLGVPENRVTNTYQTVDIPSPYLSLPIEKLKHELEGVFGLQYKNYILSYGAIEPKKNVARIIEAFLASNIDKPLVLAGAASWKADQELRLLNWKLDQESKQFKLSVDGIQRVSSRVIRLEYLSFAQLINLIRGALAVVFPSLYEGFGLPILESMLCGTPVITSNLGAMKEIAGDAALLVDPYNMREIKEAIIAIGSDRSLQSEKSMLGYKVAKYYSSEKYRERLERLYEKIAQQV